MVSSHALSCVAQKFCCLFVYPLIQAAMKYENSSEAPEQLYQYLTPLCSLVSESFTHFSGSSHYATPHNLYQTMPERTCTCPCSHQVRTLMPTYAYPSSYGPTNIASHTPSSWKSDQQASNKRTMSQ
jgi:hypothetical protein